MAIAAFEILISDYPEGTIAGIAGTYDGTTEIQRITYHRNDGSDKKIPLQTLP